MEFGESALGWGWCCREEDARKGKIFMDGEEFDRVERDERKNLEKESSN